MRYNKKLKLITLFMSMLLCVLCVSCTKQGVKTVIMKDTASTAEVGDNTGLHSGKVYKFNYFDVIDNKPVNEMLFGWLDKDNTAAVVNKQEDYLTIEAINYKYHFSKEIMKISSDITSYGLSSDGKKIAYLKGEKILLKDIQKDKDKEIGQLQPLKQSIVGIAWSGNSRFVTFSVNSYPAGLQEVYIYDNTAEKIYRIDLKEVPAASERIPKKTINYNVMISDDGTKLLINSLYDNSEYKVEYLLHLYKLNKETFLPETEMKLDNSFMVNPHFIDNDRLIYLNMRTGSLDVCDTGTGETSEIYKLDETGMKYQYFKVSKDGRSIVFIKYLQDGTVGIYQAGIQNNRLEDEKMIYRDFLPNNIWWSGDNDKVLLSGRYTYSERLDQVRQLNPAYVSLGNVIIELN